MEQTNGKIAIDVIQPNPYQRAIKPDRVKYYAAKMKREGYNESYPVTLDLDGVLVDGGHRLEAAKMVGITEVPYIVTNAPRVAHSLRCNRDGADTVPDDVFDLAELCWRLSRDGQTGEQIAQELEWNETASVTNHKNIKVKLHPVAWQLARFGVTANLPLGTAANQELASANWLEAHFRAFLHFLPCPDSNRALMRAQVQAIRELMNSDKITAKRCGQVAQRYAWQAELKQAMRDNLTEGVSLPDHKNLLRAIETNVFGKERSKANREKFDRAVSAINEQILGVQLYHDDALQRIPLFDDKSIALVVTDPPYNTTDNEWDQIGTDEEYLTWTQEWLQVLRPKLADKYHLFVFCAPEYQAQIETLLIKEGWPLKSRIIWEYRNLVKGRDVTDKFIANWQMVFHCGTHSLNWAPNWNEERFAVQHYATPQSNFKEGKNHPTAKPVGLIEHLVRVGSAPGDKVLDLFAGGGTTGEACKNVSQRRCILIERSPKYCDEIEKRLSIKRKEGIESGRN